MRNVAKSRLWPGGFKRLTHNASALKFADGAYMSYCVMFAGPWATIPLCLASGTHMPPPRGPGPAYGGIGGESGSKLPQSKGKNASELCSKRRKGRTWVTARHGIRVRTATPASGRHSFRPCARSRVAASIASCGLNPVVAWP
jgi:hypothetical protein